MISGKEFKDRIFHASIFNTAFDVEYTSTSTNSIQDLCLLKISKIQSQQLHWLQERCNLQTLVIQSSPIDPKSSIAISKMQTLQKLGVINFPVILLNLTNLKSLSLNQPYLSTDEIKSIATNLTSLEQLSISTGNKFSLIPQYITPLSKLKSLSSLEFKHLKQVSKPFVNSIIKSFKSLKSLVFQSCRIQEQEVLLLSQLLQLRFFGFIAINIDFSVYLKLSSFVSRLQGLNISFQHLFALHLGEIIQQENRLKQLVLNHCSLSDDAVIEIVKKTQHLKQLSIRQSNITIKGIEAITCNCPNLIVLKLENVIQLTDQCLILISNRLRSLKTLGLSIDSFTQKGIIYLRSLKLLQSLHLQMMKMPNKAFIKLMCNIRHLKRIRKQRISYSFYRYLHEPAKLMENFRQIHKLWLQS